MNDFKEKLTAYLNVVITEQINLKEYALRNKITVYKNGKMDKGWKGNAVEHLLNLKKNNNASSDYGFLEVKTVPFIYGANQELKIKETTCLNVINTEEIINKKFEESSLYHKIKDTLFIFINVEDDENPYVAKTLFFNLDSKPSIKAQFKKDYNELAEHIMGNISEGLSNDSYLSGHIGQMIQPRPKVGKNKEYTWAFYMKKEVWNHILNDNYKPVSNKIK